MATLDIVIVAPRSHSMKEKRFDLFDFGKRGCLACARSHTVGNIGIPRRCSIFRLLLFVVPREMVKRRRAVSWEDENRARLRFGKGKQTRACPFTRSNAFPRVSGPYLRAKNAEAR